MPRVIVFDLDNTLFDTRSIPAALTVSLFQAVRSANAGTDVVADELLELAFHDSWSIPFPVVAARHRLPLKLLRVWSDWHQSLTFTEPLQPYPDVVDALRRLRFQNVVLCLLTSGYRRVQLGKIAALGIEIFFDLILIDAVDDVHLGKEKILAQLLNTQKWNPEDVLIVGDSATSEIAAGIRLGIPTVQILRPGVTKTEAAARHVSSLTELIEWYPVGPG